LKAPCFPHAFGDGRGWWLIPGAPKEQKLWSERKPGWGQGEIPGEAPEFRPTQTAQVRDWSKIMNESIVRKSAVTFTVKDPRKGFLMNVRCFAFFVALVLVNLPDVAFAQSSSCLGIHVKILNIRNSTGNIACALFESPTGFPVKFLHYATNIIVMKIRDTQATCDFIGISRGKYALAGRCS